MHRQTPNHIHTQKRRKNNKKQEELVAKSSETRIEINIYIKLVVVIVDFSFLTFIVGEKLLLNTIQALKAILSF